MWVKPPGPVGPQLTIGLLGGSFNPAHDGHRYVSEVAKTALGLDAVWWLVTPGNPLKRASDLADRITRMAFAAKLAGRGAIVSDIESRLGTRYTVDTLRSLRRRFPHTRFVWLMGSDNLVSFHRWKDWRTISDLMPMAVIDRPGSTLKATHSRAASALRAYRHPESLHKGLLGHKAPAWIMLHDKRSALSSTSLRAQHKLPPAR